MPIYSMAIQKTEGPPIQALQLKGIIAQADLLIIAVPEHNGSIPSFFKNILDWLSRSGEDYRAFHNKAVILLSASPGGGGESVLAHTETVLNRLGAIVKAKIAVSNFFSKIIVVENGLQITDNTILNQIQDVIKNDN
jgi:chromate reductase, NAD(P)H dehydrogenase (quinone)